MTENNRALATTRKGYGKRIAALIVMFAMIICGLPLAAENAQTEAATSGSSYSWDSWEDLYNAMVAKENEDGFDHRSIDLKSAATWADNYEGYDEDGWELLVEIMDSLSITTDQTDYEKASIIADWIDDNISYGGSNFLYDVLTDRRGLCGGYAGLFCIMCAYVGVDAVEVTNSTHAWTAIKLDEEWYWADPTYGVYFEANDSWDVLYSNPRSLHYKYYSDICALIADHGYRRDHCCNNGKDHVWIITDAFNSGETVIKTDGTYAECSCGFTEYYCEACGACYVEILESDVEHDWVAEVVEPTCTSDGYTMYECSECGIFYIEDYYTYKFERTSPLGHDDSGEAVVMKEPTCTESGYSTVDCTRCGKELSRTTIPATGHTWDDGVVTKAATATTAGEMTYTCTVCSETKTESIPATGGSLADAAVTLTDSSYTYDGTIHYPDVMVEIDGAVVDNTVTKTTTTSSTKVVTGTMYTVTYYTGSRYKSAGEIPVLISAGINGLLTGEQTVYFTIEKADTTVTASIDADSIEAGSTAQITASAAVDMTGTSRTVYYESSDTSVATVDSSGLVTGVSSGVAVITVYTAYNATYYNQGYAYITVTVTEADKTDISDAVIVFGEASDFYTYDGTEKEPDMCVMLGTKELAAGTDYMVSYSDNTNAGTATVTVAVTPDP